MSNRKFKLKIKPDILGLNCIPEKTDLVIEVLLPDTVDTYKELSRSENLLDWSIEEEQVEKESAVEDEVEPAEIELPAPKLIDLGEDETLADYFIIELGIKTYNEVATFLEALLRTGLFSPSLIFGRDMFKQAVEKRYHEVAQTNISAEHVLCKTVMVAYYGELTINEAVVHILKEVKALWGNIKDYQTLTSITYKLYKKNG